MLTRTIIQSINPPHFIFMQNSPFIIVLTIRCIKMCWYLGIKWFYVKGSQSDVELSLGTEFEWSLVREQVWSVSTDCGSYDVFEDDARVLVGNWDVEFATESDLSSMLGFSVVMFQDEECFLEGRLSIDVENTLDKGMITSRPYSILLWYFETTSTLTLSKYPLKLAQSKSFL